MSPSPELLRHRTPQSARHAGDHDNFLPVHQAETFRAESHVSSREFSLELLNELPVFRERASLKKIFKHKCKKIFFKNFTFLFTASVRLLVSPLATQEFFA